MAETHRGRNAQVRLSQRLVGLAVAAALALVAGNALAHLAPLLALASIAILGLGVAAVFRPALAFAFVAFALPFYHLAIAEVLPGLRLTVLEFVGALLLLRVILPIPRPLVPPVKELPPQFWLLLAMLIWALASSAMSPLGHQDFINSTKPFSAVLVFWLLTFTFGRKAGRANRLLIVLIVGVVLAQAIGLPQAITTSTVTKGNLQHVTEEHPEGGVELQEVRAAGLMGDPNSYAFTSVAVVPLCLAGLLGSRRKWMWALATGIAAAALVLSYSRGAFLAAGCGSAWLALRASRVRSRPVLILAAVAVVSTVVAPGAYVRRMTALATGQWDLSVRWRIEGWQYALVATRDHPLLGVGPGNIRAINPRTMYPHNTFLDVAAGLGVPGLLAFLAVLALSLRDASRARTGHQGPQWITAMGIEAAIIATAIFWMFFSMFHYKMPWFLMAMATASAHSLKQQPTAAKLALSHPPSADSPPQDQGQHG